MKNRYIRINDPYFKKLGDKDYTIKGKGSYSRPYEYKFLENTLKKLGNDLEILSIASGKGSPENLMMCELDNVKYIDSYDVKDTVSKHQNQKLKTFIADARTYKSDKKYDVIVCISALEHIPSPDNAIENMYYNLKDEGIAILTFDIVESSSNTEYVPMGNKFVQNKFSPSQWKQKFEQVGFIVEDFDDTRYDDIISGKNSITAPSIHVHLSAFRFILKKK